MFCFKNAWEFHILFHKYLHICVSIRIIFPLMSWAKWCSRMPCSICEILYFLLLLSPHTFRVHMPTVIGDFCNPDVTFKKKGNLVTDHTWPPLSPPLALPKERGLNLLERLKSKNCSAIAKEWSVQVSVCLCLELLIRWIGVSQSSGTYFLKNAF